MRYTLAFCFRNNSKKRDVTTFAFRDFVVAFSNVNVTNWLTLSIDCNKCGIVNNIGIP
jgi:hypothetical protein